MDLRDVVDPSMLVTEGSRLILVSTYVKNEPVKNEPIRREDESFVDVHNTVENHSEKSIFKTEVEHELDKEKIEQSDSSVNQAAKIEEESPFFAAAS